MPLRPGWAQSMQVGLARGVALFLGGFSWLNLMGAQRDPNFDATVWWIDLRALPAGVRDTVLPCATVALIAFALLPRPGLRRCRITLALVGLVLFVAVANVVSFYSLLIAGRIEAGVPLPFSLIIALGLTHVVCVLMSRDRQLRAGGLTVVTDQARRREAWVALSAAAVLGLGFPLGQIYFFGKTDYRRPADAIVVFGARAYADGRPSDALADRVRTGCALYRAGYAPRLVFSGGPGDGDIHETEAMRRMAVGLGVPEQAIVVDEAGLNTQATVVHTDDLFDRLRCQRVLAVSHFYHLPRIKLTYSRAGREVYTVPARESYTLTKMPYLVAREVAALWVYYLRPLARV